MTKFGPYLLQHKEGTHNENGFFRRICRGLSIGASLGVYSLSVVQEIGFGVVSRGCYLACCTAWARLLTAYSLMRGGLKSHGAVKGNVGRGGREGSGGGHAGGAPVSKCAMRKAHAARGASSSTATRCFGNKFVLNGVVISGSTVGGM